MISKVHIIYKYSCEQMTFMELKLLY